MLIGIAEYTCVDPIKRIIILIVSNNDADVIIIFIFLE